MNFKKVNNIAGWAVCIIASLVYILTAEMRGSLWDCGEFVSACYKVQLPHPPGAPLFVLLGRFFIILFGNDPLTAAKAVNVMNAFASGFTILFLFWSITHFARKLMTGFKEEPTAPQMYTIIGAGIVGALAYTFSDSFWYSAVEGEVYALSSLFTALAFWIILKWERADDAAGNNRQLRNRADRWIVFFFFALGLSIGIHLLGLLVIPAAVMVYYYKRYTYSRKGAIWAFILGCIITGIVQVVIIKWSVSVAGSFDRLFVNGFGLPFFSGFTFFFLLLGVLVWAGLRWANKNNWSFLRLGLWSFAFMMLGFSTYITTLIRSNANPSLDMNNVDNPMNLAYYLAREQYGSQPILYGTHFLSQPNGLKETKTRYAKGPDNYVALPPDKEYTYPDKDYRLFIRTWDASNDQNHANYYIDWLSLDHIPAKELSVVTAVGDGIVQTQNQQRKTENYQFDEDYLPGPKAKEGQTLYPGDPVAVKIPTYGDNIKWFMSYQMGFMYWRYFMWNFAGKQNDVQGAGNKRDGNWKSGFSFIDNQRLGDQSMLPDSIKHNKENNSLYLLPFILGIIGCVYQFIKNRQDWIVTFILFFFTGIAIVVYLNQAGNQPRERDYAFAGSFYVYAMWIGLSVVAFVRMAKESISKNTSIKSILSFKGRITRLEYGLGVLTYVGLSILFYAFLPTLLGSLLLLILVWFMLAQGAKRSHDIGLNTWNTLVQLIPLAWIWLAFNKGQIGTNKYGEDPNQKPGDFQTLGNTILFTGLTAMVVLLMSDANNMNFNSFLSAFIGGVICALVCCIVTYIIHAVSDKTFNLRNAGLAATAICVLVPVLMASQEWDDHDRSNKLIAPDLARDYLEGCPKNAILFTFGDNDTYPLWYAQEVEGVRPDIRIVNTSLLGIDWYVNQLRYKVNESGPINMVWTEDQLRGISYIRNSGDRANTTQSLIEFLKNGIGPMFNAEDKSELRVTFPNHLTVPVDVNYAREQGFISATDSAVSQIQLDLNPEKGYYSLDQLTMLNVLATTNWQRPICFTSPYTELGFAPYLKQIGMIYTLVPVKQEFDGRSLSMDLVKTSSLLSEKFRGGNANVNGVYFDEENRRHLLSIRTTYAQAVSKLADAGKKEEANVLLNKSESIIHPEALPYAMVSRNSFHNRTSMEYLEAAYKADNTQLVNKLKSALKKDFEDQIKYAAYLRDNRPEYYSSDIISDENYSSQSLKDLDAMEKAYNPAKLVVPETIGKYRDSLDSAKNK